MFDSILPWSRIALTAALCGALTGCYRAEDVIQRDGDLIDELHSAGEHLTNSSIPGDIDPYNDPRSIDETFTFRFDALPQRGELEKAPWSDTYWPKNEGGMTHRWQTGEQHDYRVWTREEALAATPDQIRKLSPTEKYDLLAGNYDFPLTERERARNSRDEASWTGFCHGWAPASYFYDEPQPRTVTNADGLEIAFGSTDIKALLTHFTGEVLPSTWSAEVLPFRTAARTAGSICGNGRYNNPACHDVNPGALHVILGNQIGLRREGFVLDVDEGYQTWNQPVYAYAAERISTREPSSGAAEEAVREHVMRTDVTWTMEIQPMWEPVLGTHEQEMKTETYLYTVEVNASGDVVGGQWLMNDNQTLWTMGQVWDWLADYDRDGDSAPDLTVDERSALMKQWFTTPDAAWVIDKGEMPDEWQDVSSMYSLIGGGVTTRRELYRYMGKLPLLID